MNLNYNDNLRNSFYYRLELQTYTKAQQNTFMNCCLQWLDLCSNVMELLVTHNLLCFQNNQLEDSKRFMRFYLFVTQPL